MKQAKQTARKIQTYIEKLQGFLNSVDEWNNEEYDDDLNEVACKISAAIANLDMAKSICEGGG